ncbi:MAG: FBP domain-containing protein [Acidimicrobiia bacterium]
MYLTYPDVVGALDRAGLGEALGDLVMAPYERRDDYVFWRSRRRPRAYLVAMMRGVPTAVELRPPVPPGGHRSGMCSVCLTVHPAGGLGLWTNIAGKAGRVAGDWVCRDFDCADQLMGRADAPRATQLPETITESQRIARMRERLAHLMDRYLNAAHADV